MQTRIIIKQYFTSSDQILASQINENHKFCYDYILLKLV